MGLLSREAILGAQDLGVGPVEVPEWGGTVYLRVLTAGELERIVSDEGDALTSRSLLIRCLCDEQGVSLLRPEDHDALAEKNGFVIKRLFALALQRNGLAKGDRERAEGNSGSDPSGS